MIGQLLADAEGTFNGLVIESASHNILAVPFVDSRMTGLLKATKEYFDVTRYVASCVVVVSHDG
ncbi:hypothetical protein [Arthrobacter cavernae]|uniref:Uncharacterized protein n=1 Tax=Arthrobacter cavernae TaxID=2817681 RepID=A0A939HIR2_9MICC|nr:hypothetical protein [Arthrobacter cavernae]MBO1269989.1 hypothetical protein [Arthrobacter cavernae]